MIKAAGVVDGRPLLIFGLTGENVTRLVAGEPIRFNLMDLGMPSTEVVILYGRTEADITTQLEPLTNASTKRQTQ